MQTKIYILLLFVFAVLHQPIDAQCTASVAYVATPFNVTAADNTDQSFTATCTGQLTGITFTFSNYSDDFRGTGAFLQCNLENAAGTIIATATWPNGKDTTDQIFPSHTITASFECSNISLNSGTKYIWDLAALSSVPNLIPYGGVILFSYSSTDVYAGGNLILDGVVKTGNDAQGWAVSISNGSIATANSTQTQTVIPCTAFYNATPQLMAKVQPGKANGIAGTTTAYVWFETTQPAQYVKRHYQITPAVNAATATGTVTLYFTQAEFDAFNAVNTLKLPTGPADATGIANVRIEKRPGTSSDGTGLPQTYTGTAITIDPTDNNIVWTSTLSRWEISFAVTGFSGFFLKTSLNILPLQLLSFTVSRASNTNHLQWQTSNEIDTKEFVIERSTDGSSFNEIGTVADNGNGNYSFDDAEKQTGKVYYRLKMMDEDGAFTYSSIIDLYNQSGNSLLIYPTVFANSFTIVSTKAQTAILMDTQGKRVKTILLTSGSNYVDASALNKGIYILVTTDGGNQKIIKD